VFLEPINGIQGLFPVALLKRMSTSAKLLGYHRRHSEGGRNFPPVQSIFLMPTTP
jgi:hypothetical protein